MQTENYFTQSLHLIITLANKKQKNLINLRKAIYDRKELCVKSFQILFDAPKYWVHLFYIFLLSIIRLTFIILI